MNIMLVAVRERTREIGVRKALGATTGQVQRQFFLEGFLLTMLSGAHRLRASPLGSVRGGEPAADAGAVPGHGPDLAGGRRGASCRWSLIGVVTSTYPARRAAQLPPVEALRYEM